MSTRSPLMGVWSARSNLRPRSSKLRAGRPSARTTRHHGTATAEFRHHLAHLTWSTAANNFGDVFVRRNPAGRYLFYRAQHELGVILIHGLPTQGSGPTFERPADIRRDPTAIEAPGLRHDPFTIDDTRIHRSRVQRNMINKC